MSATAEFLQACQPYHLHSLIVDVDGERVVEGYAAPYDRDSTPLLYSLSKSFTSTAAGLAIGEGRFALTDKVLDLLPQYRDAELPAATREFTLHHLLSMTTGHTEDTLPAAAEARSSGATDPALAMLRVEPSGELGRVHVYNNGATFLAGLIVQQHTGQRLVDYLRPRLFDPLGIGAAFWDQVDGVDLGFTGLHLSSDAVARFGRLILDDGIWHGQRILPEGWVGQATAKHIDTAVDPAKTDWSQGYGYQFWRARHGFRGDGAFGQFCLVLPEQRSVIVTTASTEDMQGILDAVWSHLLPALADPDRLRTDLSDWTLPPPHTDRPVPTVSFVDGGARHTVACGRDHWATDTLSYPDGRTLPVATSGGRQADGSLTATMVVLTSPHTVSLSGSPADATLAWVPPAPLGATFPMTALALR